MRLISNICTALAGLVLLLFGLNFFFGFLPPPPSATPGSHAAAFIGALVGSKFFVFIKLCEIIGGAMLLIPALRSWGLIVATPIIINILAYNFLMSPNTPTGMGLAINAVLGLGALLGIGSEWSQFVRLIKPSSK